MDVEYETCNHIDSLARWSVLTVSHIDRWLAIDPIYPYEWGCSQVLFL